MASLNAELNNTTILTPRKSERRKTAQQRAEDIIYTLNHTFTCLFATDLLITPMLRAFGMNIGHSHAGGDHHEHHGHEHHGHAHHNHHQGHEHAHAHPASGAKGSFWQRFKNEFNNATKWHGAKHWLYGEAIGDVGAAVVTIPVQRYFPGFMNGIRSVIEPVAGGFFRRGTESASHRWADKHGLDYDAPEVVERAQKLYDYEMRHLPQMAMWTLSSIGLHYGAMRYFEKGITVGEFARQKAATAGITAAVVFGARALAPDKAHKWDESVGKHVIVPVTKKVGKFFGVQEGDVDDYHARAKEMGGDGKAKSWGERVKQDPAPAVEAVRA